MCSVMIFMMSRETLFSTRVHPTEIQAHNTIAIQTLPRLGKSNLFRPWSDRAQSGHNCLLERRPWP